MMYQGIIWIGAFAITIPCIILHIWIIFSCIIPKKNRTVRYLEANLSFGAVLHQISVGYFLAALYFKCLWPNELCGLRIFIKAIPLSIVTFTLVKITTERLYVLKNLFYPHPNSTLRTVIVINGVAVLVSVPIIFTRYYDPSSSKQSQCVTGYLFISIISDWIYRVLMFLVLCLIPSIILLKEIRAMVKLMQNVVLDDEAEGVLKENLLLKLEREFNWQRLRLMKSACIFTTLFVCYSLPIGIIETLNSPAIILPEIIRYYQKNIRDIIYIAGYLIVTICPIALYRATRDIYR